MKKRIICLLLVFVFVASLTSCFRDERKYDYDDMSKYVEIINYKGFEVEIKEDYIQQQIDTYIQSYSTPYKAKKGDVINVNLEFTEVIWLDADKKIDKKGDVISDLGIKNKVINKLGEGSYNKALEEEIIKMGVQITKKTEKIITLPNDAMFGKYAGKEVYFSCEFVSKPCLRGDVVVVDYTGYHLDSNGEIKKNDKGEEETFDTGKDAAFYIGSNLAIKDFENGLIGAEVGVAKDIKATFPEDYGSEDLKGKTVLFKVTVKSIKEAPIYNDEFVKKMGYNSTEEFESYLKNEYAYNYLNNELLEKSTFKEYPKSEYENMERQFEQLNTQYLSLYGISYEDFVLMYYGYTKDEFIKSSMDVELVYYAIAQKENYDPSPADLEAAKEALIQDQINTILSQNTGMTAEQARPQAVEYVEQELGTTIIYDEAIFTKVEKVLRASYTIKMVKAENTSVTTERAEAAKNNK
ncbi:MAG: FKBP-type peptidyl-prolyl cis-trans isomerase [Clostridia bacterium]|nr:FKBP-type peptidyl-prolyl cis-trans isomerase [Clostridia bacterium]